MEVQVEFIGVVLIIGCVVGWLASQIVEGTSFGAVADIAIGVAGAFIGGEAAYGVIGEPRVAELIGGLIGAVLLLLVVRFAAPWLR